MIVGALQSTQRSGHWLQLLDHWSRYLDRGLSVSCRRKDENAYQEST